MTHSTFGPLNRATTTFGGLNKATTTFGVTHASDDTLDQGSYVITGQNALFPITRAMVAAQGSYSVMGQDVAFPVTRKTIAAQGTYTITGQDADFPVTEGSELLLDAFPNAAAAYGLTKLRADYAGSAIRVRRSSDDAEQDIGFDGNDLDESALTTFVGAGDGFIVTAYDQSGNGRDVSQSTAAAQRQVVASGSIIKINTIPVVTKEGPLGDDPGPITSGLTNGTWSTAMYMATVLDTTDTELVLNSSTSLAGSWFGFMDSGESSTNIAGNSGTPTWRKNGAAIGTQPTTRGDLHSAYSVGEALVYSASNIDMDTDTDWTNITIWGWNNSSSGPTELSKMGTTVFYDNPSSATMEGVEAQLMTDYGIT